LFEPVVFGFGIFCASTKLTRDKRHIIAKIEVIEARWKEIANGEETSERNGMNGMNGMNGKNVMNIMNMMNRMNIMNIMNMMNVMNIESNVENTPEYENLFEMNTSGSVPTSQVVTVKICGSHLQDRGSTLRLGETFNHLAL
jgi:hypothetical protein